MTEELKKIAVFQKKEIRRTFYKGEWWFVISDIIEVLTESDNPNQYLRNMRTRDKELALLMDPVKKGGVQIEHPLLLEFKTPGGPQKLLTWNTEGIFRLIQSIASKKAEPFKRWLAKVGYERVQEIENPELAQKRMKAIYRAKGYNDDWIEKRARGIAVHQELTDEWQRRGIDTQQEYAILTSEISKAAFGLTPSEYKKLKNLKRENLRDHMTDLELIFTMLGEASTTEIARKEDAQGLWENKGAAKRGGGVAKRARKQLEEETGEKIVTKNNYLYDANNKKIKGRK